MKELVEKVAALYADFSKDANAQIENGNKAAGTRARKASLEIEKAMKEFRKASLEASKKLRNRSLLRYQEKRRGCVVRCILFFYLYLLLFSETRNIGRMCYF